MGHPLQRYSALLGENFNLNFSANVRDIAFGIVPDYKSSYAGSEYTYSLTT